MNQQPLGAVVRSYAKRTFFTILLPLILYAILCIAAPKNFLSGSTAIMIITQCLPNVALGWAMVFGMSVGLFDFSAGARLVLAGLIGVYFSQIMGFPGFVFGCVVGSIVLAALVGVVYSYLKIPSIIAGFAALLVFESMGVMLVKKMINAIDANYLFLAKTPYIYIVMILMFVVIYLVFNNTKFGYQIKAIGGNENVARSMGINSGRLKFMTYLIGGVFMGIATILYVSNAGTIQSKDGMASMSLCFTPMMGVMIGMFLPSCNLIIGTFIGELCITIVGSAMIAFNWESRLQNVVVGIFLMLFMAFQLNKSGWNLKKLFGKSKAQATT